MTQNICMGGHEIDAEYDSFLPHAEDDCSNSFHLTNLTPQISFSAGTPVSSVMTLMGLQEK